MILIFQCIKFNKVRSIDEENSNYPKSTAALYCTPKDGLHYLIIQLKYTNIRKICKVFIQNTYYR